MVELELDVRYRMSYFLLVTRSSIDIVGVDDTAKTELLRGNNLMIIAISGAKVVIASRSIDKLENAASELRKVGDVTPFQCNIRKEEDVQ